MTELTLEKSIELNYMVGPRPRPRLGEFIFIASGACSDLCSLLYNFTDYISANHPDCLVPIVIFLKRERLDPCELKALFYRYSADELIKMFMMKARMAKAIDKIGKNC